MITDVVAALIWNGDRFLACQRPAHKARGLLWEFVGGKTEPGETLQEALVRECYEELAVTVRVGEVFMTLVHEYPDLTVRLTLFNASIISGEIQKLEHNDIRWITTQEIDSYDFCPADVEILKKLKTIKTGLQARLISLSDQTYKKFQCTLIPTLDPDKVIGVRFPHLRSLSRRMQDIEQKDRFLSSLPHDYYEEDTLHAMLISNMTDPKETIEALEKFLPFVDNWSTCDTIIPKAFKNRPEGLIQKVHAWIASPHTYTVRFAIGILMRYYLEEGFSKDYLTLVAAVKSEEYYVKMMSAWYFATALAKQYDCAIRVLEERMLPKWIHNKTIQKAVESYQISAEQKTYLKTLKIKQ
jgi:mutator protein MutT